MRKILFLLLVVIPALVLASEPVREWKSKSGKTIIEASLDTANDSDPETVFLLKDGKKYKIPFKNLSEEDRAYVTQVRENARSLAEDEDVGLEEVEDDADSRGIVVVPAGNRYALLIGVNTYAKPIRSLKYCVNDMKLLAESFEKIGVPKENIFLVTDDSPEVERRPTGANIRQQIENVTQLMGPKDQLTIAFSGHGAMVDEKSYLCPSDTNLNDKHSIVSRDWAFDQLEKCKAKQKIFIIDACRDEVSFGGSRTLGKAKTLEDPIGADTHGFILIASCDKKQKTWEHDQLKHGVFTHFLAEGLLGAAKDEDGYVSVLNLFQYASSKTKKYVYRELNQVQVPTFRQGDEMTDFCIAKLTGTTLPAPAETTLPASSRKAGDRMVLRADGIDYAFRWCPPGEFMMGSPSSEEGRYDVETQHRVKLTKGFWLLETEVTQEMWQSVMGSNPSRFSGAKNPVEQVNWDDCQAFCQKLSQKLGQQVKLPTEAQWEYACRAGTKTPFNFGNTLNGDKANCDGNYPYGTSTKGAYLAKTAEVGSYTPNAWGLYDMHGNVWEWCSDYYDKDYYVRSPTIDPENTTVSQGRVNRGGCWRSLAEDCRSAFRYWFVPLLRFNYLGLRVLLVPSQD